MTKIIHSSPNRLLSFKIKRGSELIDLDIKTSEYAIASEGIIDTIGVIGIRPEVYYEDISFVNALSNGMKQTISSFGLIVYSLKMLGSGAASISDLGGPIMIAQLAGQTAEAGITLFNIYGTSKRKFSIFKYITYPWSRWGHIFIHLIEGILRRPLKIKTRIAFSKLGWLLLMLGSLLLCKI